MNLYKILRNRLKRRTNKNYVKWAAEHKTTKTNENHHLLKSFIGGRKQNDYLLAELTPEFHKLITYVREPTDDEFLEMLIAALENLQDYTDYLEDTVSILEKRPKIKEIEWN